MLNITHGDRFFSYIGTWTLHSCTPYKTICTCVFRATSANSPLKCFPLLNHTLKFIVFIFQSCLCRGNSNRLKSISVNVKAIPVAPVHQQYWFKVMCETPACSSLWIRLTYSLTVTGIIQLENGLPRDMDSFFSAWDIWIHIAIYCKIYV